MLIAKTALVLATYGKEENLFINSREAIADIIGDIVFFTIQRI